VENSPWLAVCIWVTHDTLHSVGFAIARHYFFTPTVMQQFYKDVQYAVEGNIIGKVWQYVSLEEPDSPMADRYYEVELLRGSWNNCHQIEAFQESDIANAVRVLRRAEKLIRKHKDAEVLV
jgi:hypothetical protein